MEFAYFPNICFIMTHAYKRAVIKLLREKCIYQNTWFRNAYVWCNYSQCLKLSTSTFKLL